MKSVFTSDLTPHDLTGFVRVLYSMASLYENTIKSPPKTN